MKKRFAILLVLAALLVMTGVVSANDFSGVMLVTSMSGAEEAPNPGDPDGSGYAVIRLNYGQSQVCWEISYEGIAPATAAHIHVNPAGVAGPVVVPLNPNVPGCVTASQDLIKAIIQNPEGYYVNVHNPEFPAGAIRGQLSNVGLSD